MKLPALKIGKLVAEVPIVQGGMAIRLSTAPLAAAVANEGGIGLIAASGMGLDELRKEIPEDKLNPIIECLADDPRPSYQDDGREYGMKFGSLNVKFTVANGILTVNKIEK